MTDYLNILYFCVLLIAVLPFLMKLGIRRSFEYASLWILIFLVIGIIYMFRGNLVPYTDRFMGELIPGSPHIEGKYLVINKSNDGHYYINIEINGYGHRALVDTGASEVMIPYSYAAQAGVKISNNTRTFYTANGIAEAYRATANIKVGDILFQDFTIYIQTTEPELFLVGMSFLQKFSEFRFEDDKLYLRP